MFLSLIVGMQQLKIWLIQTGEPYPFQKEHPLMRSGLLLDELYLRGHEITWWGASFSHLLKSELVKSDTNINYKKKYTIKLLHANIYKRNISLARYLHYQKVEKKFTRLIQHEEKPDIIIASLPVHGLAYQAVKFANNNNIPVIVDVRDLWPDYFLTKVPRLFRLLAYWALRRDFFKAKYALQNTTAITAVSNSYLDWGLLKANRVKNNFDHVFYIGSTYANFLDNKKYDTTAGLIKHEFKVSANSVVVLFIGSFGESYDLHTIANAAKKMHSDNRNKIHFILAGDGQYFPAIKKEVNKLNNITLTGWVNSEQIGKLLKIADIGLVPYTESAPQSLPNKPFHYASAGLPVLSSLSGEFEIIREKYNIGENYLPGNVDSMCESLQKMISSPKRLLQQGENAKKLFNNKFNAGKIYREFADHIENLVANK
jgi:glycosyltransferase involved in cell wall biosynthesis